MKNCIAEASPHNTVPQVISSDNSLICFCIQQASHLCFISHRNLHNPPFSIRIFVHQFRLIFKSIIEFQHFAGYRQIQLRNSLHRFYRTERIACLQCITDGFTFNKYNVSQLTLSIISNADKGLITFYTNPFVFLGVL